MQKITLSSIPARALSWLAQGFLILGLGTGLAAGAASDPAAQTIQPGQVPAGLSAPEWSQIQTQLKAAQYEIDLKDGAATGRNPAQRLGLSFADGGLTVSPQQGDWRFGLKTTAYGRVDATQPVPVTAPSVDGVRVEYRHEQLTEWYHNREDGLEHGYTLANKPQGEGQVQLQIALTGSLKAERLDGDAIVLGDGKNRLRYHKLKVFDASGKTLPATMTLASADTLMLAYDDTAAQYPVTVDPLLVSEEAKLTQGPGDGYAHRVVSSFEVGQNFGRATAVDGDTLIVGESDAARIFVRSNGVWTEQAKLFASDGANFFGNTDRFGFSVAVDGDTAIVGAFQSDNQAGAAYVYTRSGTVWTEQAKLVADDRASGDGFGISVALEGDTALVGAPSDDDQGRDSGSVYVFTRSGTVWTQETKLLAGDGVGDDQFGRSVALDSSTALIGAPSNGSNFSGNGGSAYVFTRSGTTWMQQAKLVAGDGSQVDRFGDSVDLDGGTALVGATQSSGNSPDSGSAYVFVRRLVIGLGTQWEQQAKLLANDGVGGDRFGRSVALDGDIALIGASGSLGSLTSGASTAYIFSRSDTAWTQQAKLIASGGSEFDRFGASVALEGGSALIGAPGDDSNHRDSGSAYVFVREIGVLGPRWVEQAKLRAGDGAAFDAFGYALALGGDTAVVGAYQEDDNGQDSGAAHVFVRQMGEFGPQWVNQAKLLASDGEPLDAFGSAIALDGDTALVGASSGGEFSGQGAAYVFTRSGTVWTQEAKLLPSNGSSFDCFGESVALDNDTALIGARCEGENTPPAGAAYVFTRSGTAWTQQARLVAEEAEFPDQFGLSVALDGDSALIGALDREVGNADRVAVGHVFTRSGSAWSPQAKLLAGVSSRLEAFTSAVALDGDTALVGSAFDDANDNESGSVYVFTRNGTGWTQQARLVAEDGVFPNYFGHRVALDGDTALIGATFSADSLGRAGAAYAFTRSGSVWAQRARFAAGDGALRDQFGLSVALEGDTVLVGAPGADHDGSFDAGAAYVYRLAQNLDYGDAPFRYPSLLADDGARHDSGTLFFGDKVDYEADASVNTGATGDDIAGEDDEDGVDFSDLAAGQEGKVYIKIAGKLGGRVNLWIDTDRNDVWDEDERVVENLALEGGDFEVPIVIPSDARIGQTFARARISTAALDTPTGYAADGEVEDHRVEILAPQVSIADASVIEGNSGSANSLAFEVTLSWPAVEAVSVNWAIAVGGTANASDTVSDASGTLDFSPGQTEQTLLIPISGDATPELDETLMIALSAPVNARIGDGSATGTILNDDVAVVGFAAPTSSIGEGDGTASIAVALPEASPVEVTVGYRVSGGTAGMSDASLLGGTLSFAPGVTEQTLTVSLLDDAVAEEPETLDYTLEMPTSANLDLLRTSHTLTIVDDDRINDVSISASPASTKEEAGKGKNAAPPMASFTVTRSGDVSQALSVNYATADGTALAGSDYQSTSGTLIWGAGDASSRTISVPIIDDAVSEAAETFSVQMTDSNGESAGNPSSATVTILASDCKGKGCK